MKLWRGIAFDLGVGLILAAIVSGPMIYAAGVVHVAVKRGLRLVGVM